MGPEFDDIDWRQFDPRQYDPRRIVREALLDDEPDERAGDARSTSTTRPDPLGRAATYPTRAGPTPFDEPYAEPS